MSYYLIFFISFFLLLSPVVFSHSLQEKDYLSTRSVLDDKIKSDQINNVLDSMLTIIPHVAQTRVGLIHVREPIYANLPQYVFDIGWSRTNNGYIVAPVTWDIPLNQIKDYVIPMAEGNCVIVKPEDLTDQGVIERLEKIKMTGFIACPLITDNNIFIGQVYSIWEQPDSFPNDYTLAMDITIAATKKILIILKQ